MQLARPTFVSVTCMRLLAWALLSLGALSAVAEVDGLLRVHPANARYLTNDSGEPILLAGSHTWATFQDYRGDRPLDYDEWLASLEAWGHNFFRGWTWEDGLYTPTPYRVTAQGRFDLEAVNPAYLSRLEERVARAEERGIYLSVMLFQGWSVSRKNGLRTPDPWLEHPYRDGNEVQGLGLSTPDGESTHTLENRRVTDLQRSYVREVVEALNEFDNVVWEISNESHEGSVAWQYEMIDTIREVESSMPKQHLVWMSCAAYGGNNAEVNTVLFESPADLVSPCRGEGDRYVDNPPAVVEKVVLADTDHLHPDRASVEQLWRGFMRGMHPMFMDWYTPLNWWTGSRLADDEQPAIRSAVGTMRRIAESLELARFAPQHESESFPMNSRFALISTQDVTASTATFDHEELLGYVSAAENDAILCDLEVGRSYGYAWYDAVTGAVEGSGTVDLSKRCARLKVPEKSEHGLLLHFGQSGDELPFEILSIGSGAVSRGPRGTSRGSATGEARDAAYDWTGRDDNPDQFDSSEADNSGGL